MTPAQVDQALLMCAEFMARDDIEGFRERPYLCPAKVPTIGIGTTVYADGRKVTLADGPITNTQALQQCANHLRKRTLPDVLRLCPGLDTPRRLAAVLSWGYNVGTAGLEKSGLRREVNRQDWVAAGDQLKRWNKSAGTVLSGLTRRRALEAEMLA